jgi:flagellar M-ring protein FliF
LQNVISIWNGLDARRRVIVGLATIAVFASVLLMSRMAASPSLSLLYSGLETSAAGEVVQALEQRGETYEVRGGSIFVPAMRRDELRMTLASAGLPASGGAGYELLDSLTGFGTTSQMFDAAYWRAKEGELARTMVASPLVRAARVHLSNPGTQLFQRGQTPSASVFVTPSNNGVSGPQARAFAFLVSSAVTGLSVESVAVIDATTGVVISADETLQGPQAGADRAIELKKSVQRLLEAHVGFGRAVVEVSIETVLAREAITERRFDPEGRVAISTDTEERSANANGQAGGNVTVASNLPDGAGAEGGGSTSNNTETRERVNFEVSETQREILRVPGAIKRLTVAVLVDGVTTTDANGDEQWQPRSEEDMGALRELVASAVGLDEARGDSLTLKSMIFEPVEPMGTSVEPNLLQSLNLDLMNLIQLAVLAVVALAISMFVVRPILARPPAAAQSVALAAPVPGNTGQEPQLEAPTMAAMEFDGPEMPDLATMGDFDFALGGDDLPDLPTYGGDSTSDDPVTRLRQLIADRQGETLEVLRGWMEDEKEKV